MEALLNELRQLAVEARIGGQLDLAAAIDALVARFESSDDPAALVELSGLAVALVGPDIASYAAVDAATAAAPAEPSDIEPVEATDAAGDVADVEPVEAAEPADSYDDYDDDYDDYDDDYEPRPWRGFVGLRRVDGQQLSDADATAAVELLFGADQGSSLFGEFEVVDVSVNDQTGVSVAQVEFADGADIDPESGELVAPLPAPIPARGSVPRLGIVEAMVAAAAADADPNNAVVDGSPVDDVEVSVRFVRSDGQAWTDELVDAAMQLASPSLAVLGTITWTDREIDASTAQVSGSLDTLGSLPAELARGSFANSAADVPGAGRVLASVSVISTADDYDELDEFA